MDTENNHAVTADAGHDDTEEHFDPAPHRPSRARLFVTAGIALAILAGLTVAGVVPRVRANHAAVADRARSESEPARVVVEKPQHASVGDRVSLPASIQPVQEALVYARTNGYVRSFKADLGDKVKAGQLLAEIDTPELDQELLQAQAASAQASAAIEQSKTQLTLTEREDKRYKALASAGIASQQDADEKRSLFEVQGANVRATEAALGSANANVSRLRDLKGFSRVLAPFDGVVTSRTTEVGQLVAAGTGAGQALFKVARTDVMRVFVNVPQLYAPAVHVGDSVTLALREFPARAFEGKITRTSEQLDTVTRTLLTEVRIANDDHALISGMYGRLALPVKRTDAPLSIRSTALVANASGTRVAVVEDGKIHWRDVRVDGDMGDRLVIAAGVTESDQVVTVPSDRLQEGLSVTPEQAKTP